MALPGVTITLQDFGLGIVPQGGDQIVVKLGICSAGLPLELYSFGDLTTLRSTLGSGPLAEAAAHSLAVSGSEILCLPLEPTQAGAASSVAYDGSGSGTVAVSFAPAVAITVRITTTGVPGVGKFTYQIGSGAISQPATIPSDPFLVPGSLTYLTFAIVSFTSGNSYVMDTDGSVKKSGIVSTNIAQDSSPLDNYEVVINISKAGALGTAQYKYSLDGGDTFSPIALVPASGTSVISSSGLVLTFANTFVVSTNYSFSTITAGFTDLEVADGLTELETTFLSRSYSMLHLVGPSYTTDAYVSADSVKTTCSQLDTHCTTLFNLGKYVVAVAEVPTIGSIIPDGYGGLIVDEDDTDSVILSTFDDFQSPFVGVAGGDCELASSLSGRTYRRNAAWPLTARLAAVPPGEDAGRVMSGALTGVVSLYRDENATPALDAGRFCTLRSFIGLSGFYITGAHTMAALDSDFSRLANRRVINEACTITRAAGLLYINGNVGINPKTGKIAEKDARQIESAITAKLNAGLIVKSVPDASAARCVVDRNSNILQTSTMNLICSVVPLGYTTYVDILIGFALTLS